MIARASRSSLHLDTHVVVWLYAGEHGRFPIELKQRLNTDNLLISPMVRLELTYLYETRKISDPGEDIVAELGRSIGLADDDEPMSRTIDLAMAMRFTRDPFDRIIAAHAVAAGCPLATKDADIRAAYPDTVIWD
jgi:PIN domain nuclease of toxin-antitoxin system